MAKPYGMTSAFQLVVPTRIQDAIYDAVALAIADNMSPEDFRREAAECWAQEYRERQRRDAAEWRKP